MSKLQQWGNMGSYLDEGNVITFRIGSDTNRASQALTQPDDFSIKYSNTEQARWLGVDGFNVLARGLDNQKCERIERDIKGNRLLPRLINKQVNMLYGKGPHIYKEHIDGGKIKREWQEEPTILKWLRGWEDNGIEMSYKDFGLGVIKRFYFFRDFFVKKRMSLGKAVGRYPIAGCELVENKLCRLATTKKDAATDIVLYNDLRHILVGDWQRGNNFKAYPLFRLRDIDKYNFAAISHHRESSVGEYYGENETHEGVKIHLKSSNELPQFIDSFLNNALAAKVHVIIPNAWVTSKRTQIEKICKENADRKKKNEPELRYNGLAVGSVFRESLLIEFMKQELNRLSSFLSGKDNQGKAYATVSFKAGATEAEEWKIQPIDLKYKEYISSLIEYDKHINEVLLGSVGMDASISSVSKDGVISKSGSDVYYNYLLYLMALTPDDEKCSEPFNNSIRANFPELYEQGFRVGYLRETPTRQEDVSSKDRLNQQQS